MTTRTKIICTIGPSVNTHEKVLALIEAGMNVARLNYSHGLLKEHLATIDLLKKARKELQVPLAIMLDTRGPEIRIGTIGEASIALEKGDQWHLVKEKVVGDQNKVTITPGNILDNLSPNDRVLFDDGYLLSHVVKTTSDGVIVEIDHGGRLSSGKGVNLPDIFYLDLPALTEKDAEDIRASCQKGIEIIAVSFVRTAEHIISLKNFLAEIGHPDVLVMAKIESRSGVEHFDSILQVSDGVMIARGDLGVEVPLSTVPRLQKEMIRKCYLAGKPSITATQMLESMIHHRRPTRAEVSDVANAIYDSTSAVMLSGETAIGKYPIEVVQVMKSIIQESEADFDYRRFFEGHGTFIYHDVTSSVTLATVKTAYSSHATAIFVFTSGGSTARLLSRLRPEMPIIAMTSNKKAYHQMALNWGVISHLSDEMKTFNEAFAAISQFALEQKLVSYGDLVVATAGSTFGVAGTTNMMIVENIGEVLVRGHLGIGDRIHGNVKILLAPKEEIKPYAVRGQLLVIPQCNESFLPYIQEAAGVILQNHVDDQVSETFAIEAARSMNKPIIVQADAACRILKEGQLVTLEPKKALVYKGVVL
ncbi:MAG: pyruvate kinase [Waddliaceae bacterium]